MKIRKLYWLLGLGILFCLTAKGQSSEGEFQLEGIIESRSDDLVKVKLFQGNNPEAGFTCGMSKYFEREIFGAKTTGWLSIASVEITELSQGIAVAKIIEEKSQIIVNGEQVDHFLPGNRVRFTWGESDRTFTTEEK